VSGQGKAPSTHCIGGWVGPDGGGYGGEKKNSQPLPGLEPPIIHPVAQRYTTELSQLLNTENHTDFYFSTTTLLHLPSPLEVVCESGSQKTQEKYFIFSKGISLIMHVNLIR
jgi:hypothetical protein